MDQNDLAGSILIPQYDTCVKECTGDFIQVANECVLNCPAGTFPEFGRC
jgi:hypothetical protein